jgi:hypothetical protein
MDSMDEGVARTLQAEQTTAHPSTQGAEGSTKFAETVRSQPLSFDALDADGSNLKIKLGDFGHGEYGSIMFLSIAN